MLQPDPWDIRMIGCSYCWGAPVMLQIERRLAAFSSPLPRLSSPDGTFCFEDEGIQQLNGEVPA